MGGQILSEGEEGNEEERKERKATERRVSSNASIPVGESAGT